MRKIIDGLKYWGQLFLLPVYGLSFLMPRDKKIWLFGSTFGRRFADNPKYFYLYMSQHKEKNIDAVWISHDKEIVKYLNQNGYKAYYYKSFKGIIYCLRAKVYIFDNYSKDISFWLSAGATKVNLWHGVGNKRINYDNKHDLVRHPKNIWERFKYFPRRLSDEKPSHYILATSPTMCKIFARAFQVHKSHVIQAGYPRNDILVDDNIVKNIYSKQEKKALNYIKTFRENGGKVDLYMPTFRDSEKIFLDIMNLDKFNEFLIENNILFVTKLHPKSKLKEKFNEISYSNIFNLDADMDPYVFLGQADVLTTDYSSIYSDYMLLDRPVVAFQYDYEEYSSNTRDGYFDFDKYMPEKKAKTMEELMQVTVQVLENDESKHKRHISRKVMFASDKADANETLYKEIIKIIN